MGKVKKEISKIFWLAMVPLLAGCGGGGGLAALGLGSLFGLTSGGGFSSPGALALLDGAGGAIPTLANPEPTSMILLGTGIAAMAYFKKGK